MRKTLLASTCLATLLSTTAHAETTITTATTAPVRTSTIKSGAPDDIKITSADDWRLAQLLESHLR